MNKYPKIMIKSEDIFQLMKHLERVGWKTIRETSINRILYLSAVLYSFRYPSVENIFEKDYNFTVTLSGPEDAEIENALTNLLSNEVIEHTNKGYCLSSDNAFKLNQDNAQKKDEWFDDIAYIIGLYGEDKIFDFIFRDPEYRMSIGSNSTYNLNLGENNNTLIFLRNFKTSFEEKLDNIEDNLSNREYLELYFEYVFGKIIRGEK